MLVGMKLVTIRHIHRQVAGYFTVHAGNFKLTARAWGIYILIKFEQADDEQKGEGSEGNWVGK
jgi:hypothetical protein